MNTWKTRSALKANVVSAAKAKVNAASAARGTAMAVIAVSAVIVVNVRNRAHQRLRKVSFLSQINLKPLQNTRKVLRNL